MPTLACRHCRVRIDAESGCAICNPLRRHLVSVGENTSGQGAEDLTLSGVAKETVAALRERVSHYRAGLRELPQSETYSTGLVKTAAALAKVLESARKLQEDGVAAVETMTFLERAELFIGWYTALPPAYRGRLREQMADYEAQLARPMDPLALPASDD